MADGPLCSRNARSRTPLVGRAQWGTISHLLLGKSERARKEYRLPGALLARRTRTLGRCSFDARSQGRPWLSP